MNETIDKIASELEVPAAQLATDLWRVAEWIETNRNRGYSIVELQATGVELPVYMLKESVHTALDGIIFESFDGPRTRRYSNGWMCRKNPNWRVTWKQRFGEYDPDRAALVDQWQAAQDNAKAIEAAKPKRKTERFAEGRFEDYTSIEIAHRAAVADVLTRRYRELRWLGNTLALGIWRYQANLWWGQHILMRDELEYRTQAEPEQRSSKKKTREAAEDFAKAKVLLEAGTGYFFSKEFIEQILIAVDEPNLEVDFEHLPRQPLAQTPVRWMRDHEVVTDFMRFLDVDHDPKSFEYEDKQLILDTLKRMYARAKGQKVDDAEIKIGGENAK